MNKEKKGGIELPKPEKMTVEEIMRELAHIKKQKTAGKVGTPNIYVRENALQDELNRRIKALKRQPFTRLRDEDKWKKVDEAMTLVDQAIDSTEFEKWVETNRDNLDYEYDNYQGQCARDFEEPDGLYYWALGRFVQEKLNVKKEGTTNAKTEETSMVR